MTSRTIACKSEPNPCGAGGVRPRGGRSASGLAELLALDNSHDIFVRNLRIFLDNARLSNAALARELAINPATVTQWFKGKGSPSVKTIGEIARILKIPPRWLFNDADNFGPAPNIKVDPIDAAFKTLAKATGRKVIIEQLKKTT